MAARINSRASWRLGGSVSAWWLRASAWRELVGAGGKTTSTAMARGAFIGPFPSALSAARALMSFSSSSMALVKQ